MLLRELDERDAGEVAGNDEAGKVAAKRDLDGFAARLALYLSDVVKNALPAEPLTDAITMHDTHLVNHVEAYAAKRYDQAQQREQEGYQQMLVVANTLVGAIQRTVKPQLPVGGSQTGGGGTVWDGIVYDSRQASAGICFIPTTAPRNGMKSGAEAGTAWRRSSKT